jgi:hypothetical protein
MDKKTFFLFEIVAIYLIAGCAHWDLHLQDQERRYLNRPLEEMYSEYGVPFGVAPLQSGGKFIEFQYYRGEYACKARVKTDSMGKVISISVGGQKSKSSGLLT